MEDNRKIEDGGGSKAAKAARLGGYVFGAIAAIFLAAWVVTLFLSRRPAGEEGVSPGQESEAVVRSAIGGESPEGFVRLRLRVSVLDEAGKYKPIGSPIAESVGLTLLGSDDKSYKAFFDKVGLWVVDIPAGTYVVAAAQPSLGKRGWTLAGAGVKSDGKGGYALRIRRGAEPPVLDLVLR